MIGRVHFDFASALVWGAALAGPGRHNVVVPYGFAYENGELERRPLVRGYHGREVARTDPDFKPPQTARLWDRWSRELTAAQQWAIAPGRLGLVVVDVDDPDLCVELLDAYGDTPVFVESPSGGMHLYYRAPSGHEQRSLTGVRGPGTYDIKSIGSTVHAPGSRHHEIDGVYHAFAPGVDGDVVRVERGRYVPLVQPRSLWHELPVFRTAVFDAEVDEWAERRGSTRRLVMGDHEVALPDSPELRKFLANYVAAAGPAVSGCGGDKHLYTLIQKVLDFGPPLDVALDVFRAWNETCEPPWSARDLEAKVRYHYAWPQREHPIGCRAHELWALSDGGADDDLSIESIKSAIAALRD